MPKPFSLQVKLPGEDVYLPVLTIAFQRPTIWARKEDNLVIALEPGDYYTLYQVTTDETGKEIREEITIITQP